ncbi:MAG: phosphotransferase, partial [Candidatus Bipolaricaulota bacterium]
MPRFDELGDAERAERKVRLAEKALRAYGLAGSLTLVAERTNLVYRLRCGGASYAVRLSPPGRETPALERELLWLAALGRETELPIPEPLLTRSGELFHRVSMEGVPGTRAVAVLAWVEGERREADLEAADGLAAGRLAAALHRHAEAFPLPEERAAVAGSYFERLEAARSALDGALAEEKSRRLLENAAAYAARVARAVDVDSLDSGIVHGRLVLRRLRYGDEEVGALGFGECLIRSFAEDLAVLWADLGGRESTPQLRHALLEGYRSTRALSSSSEGSLSAFAALHAIEAAAGALPRGRTTSAAGAERAAPRRGR